MSKKDYINNSEWHHTSVYGNKTTFYGWNEPYYADVYAENKKAIDKAIKAKDFDAVEDLFENSDAAKEYEERERLEWMLFEAKSGYNNAIRAIQNATERVEYANAKAVVSRMIGDGIIQNSVFTASNGVKIRVNDLGKETQMQYPEGERNDTNRNLARSEYEAAKSATRTELEKEGGLTQVNLDEYDQKNKDAQMWEGRIAEIESELEDFERNSEAAKRDKEVNSRFSLKAGKTSPEADVETIRSEAEQLADELHTPVRIVEDVEEISDGNERVQAMKRRARGWYDVNTGEVVIVLPNADNAADAREPVFHEVVAHKGLRELLGKDFDIFLYNVYANASLDIRRIIADNMVKNGWGVSEATEEYMAKLAEDGPTTIPESIFLYKVKDALLELLRAVGINLGFRLSNNELRYVLWKSYQNLHNKGIIGAAEDVVMQNKLEVGNYSVPRFSLKEV